MLRTHTCGELNKKDAGKKVRLCGWVDTIREHGKITFVDLRDRYGKTQIVIKGEHNLRGEFVVCISGEVKNRKPGTDNKDLSTGEIEVLAEKIEIINEAKVPSIKINENEVAGDDIRMKYRFLDLRRPDMQRNLFFRMKVAQAAREYFVEKNFIEIETPLLVKPTPEGARDYIVPSRVNPGKFYALPQSPQLYKQILMIAGFDRYFQFARCLRDEDLRADRQPEHTQMDLEMSFIEQKDILEFVEGLYKHIFKKVLGIQLNDFKILTYEESMKKYKTDKPDLRKDKNNPKEFAFCWVVDFPLFSYNKDEKKWEPEHHIFTSPKKEHIKYLEKEPGKVLGDLFDLVLNGTELGSGSIRINNPELQERVMKIIGMSKESARKKFGFLLDAYEYGGPIHGGMGLGFDRLVALMLGYNDIREVIAFPKNKSAQCPMDGSPSEVEPIQLKEAHINLVEDKKEKKNIYNEIKKLLDKNKIKYKTLEHEAVFTSEEAAKARGTKLEEAAKALVCKANNKFIFCCVRGNDNLDISKLKKNLRLDSVRTASADEVKEVTGFSIGSVPPFGNLFRLDVYFDEKLAKNENAVFNAGSHTNSIIMKMKDLIKITGAKILDISAKK